MGSVQHKRSGSVPIWIIVVWLIVGPVLFLYVLNDIGVRLPLAHDDSIDIFGQTILGPALAGIALFLLPVPLWQRVLSYVVYAPIAGVLTFIVAVSIACYVFHSCL
jgi:hypothetical protein